MFYYYSCLEMKDIISELKLKKSFTHYCEIEWVVIFFSYYLILHNLLLVLTICNMLVVHCRGCVGNLLSGDRLQ